MPRWTNWRAAPPAIWCSASATSGCFYRRGERPSENPPSRPVAAPPDRPGRRAPPRRRARRRRSSRRPRRARARRSMNRLSTHSLIASKADREVTLRNRLLPGSSRAISTHGEAEIGLDAEQAGRQQPRQMPVALRVEQRRRDPDRERPEAPRPQHQQHAKCAWPSPRHHT